MQTAGRVLAEWNRTPQALRPRRILIDTIGIGAGVHDRLREQKLPVTSVNVGEPALATELYARVRDELWFRGRDWQKAEDAVLPEDRALVAELTSVRYDFSSSGKYEVESRDAMKRRGLPSPDLADAFLLTFAAGEHLPRIQRNERQRTGPGWRRDPPRRRRGSYMAM